MTRFYLIKEGQQFTTVKAASSYLTWKKIGPRQAVVVAVAGNMLSRWLDVVDNFDNLKQVYPL